jgi:hypothetical protein
VYSLGLSFHMQAEVYTPFWTRHVCTAALPPPPPHPLKSERSETFLWGTNPNRGRISDLPRFIDVSIVTSTKAEHNRDVTLDCTDPQCEGHVKTLFTDSDEIARRTRRGVKFADTANLVVWRSLRARIQRVPGRHVRKTELIGQLAVRGYDLKSKVKRLKRITCTTCMQKLPDAHFDEYKLATWRTPHGNYRDAVCMKCFFQRCMASIRVRFPSNRDNFVPVSSSKTDASTSMPSVCVRETTKASRNLIYNLLSDTLIWRSSLHSLTKVDSKV